MAAPGGEVIPDLPWPTAVECMEVHGPEYLFIYFLTN
jgi:hypothetical protein